MKNSAFLAMDYECTQAGPESAQTIAQLVNSAYRGESSKQGWTTEADLLDGQRTDAQAISEIINADDSMILVAEHNDSGAIHGCVYLKKNGTDCYLGMLTVAPHLQAKGIGRFLLGEAEAFAQFWDCTRIDMTVIATRTELIAWYEKHGYQKNGETKPFPYGDERFGIPKTQDLQFIVLEKHI